MTIDDIDTTPHDWEGKVKAAIEMVEDITEKKKKDDELQRYREKLEDMVKEHHIIFVSDNGIGLTEEETRDIFGLFQRQKTATGISGAGLGLAIVKEIAEQHEGTVWTETGRDRGIIFTVSIAKNL